MMSAKRQVRVRARAREKIWTVCMNGMSERERKKEDVAVGNVGIGNHEIHRKKSVRIS